MAGMVKNLAYRVSVSAIVGAIVAGGLIYLNNERVLKSYRTNMMTQAEQQAIANNAVLASKDELVEAVAALETAISALESANSTALVDLGAKIDAIPETPAADYSAVLEAVAAIKMETAGQLAEFKTALEAQGVSIAELPQAPTPDYTAILDAIAASSSELAAQINALEMQGN